MTTKSNTKEFKEKVKKLVGNEYTVLGEYVNSKTKIRMLHAKCGYEYAVTPNSFISGDRCPKCGGTMPKNTEIFKKEVFDLVGSEYTVLSEYINSQTKIGMLHSKCGHEYEMTPVHFLQGQRCPKCFGTPLKTTEQFKKEVFDLVGNEYTVLGEYINGKTKIGMLHSKCGYKYAVTPNSFISGDRCPKCGGTMPKNTEIFKKEVFDLVGSEYTVLSEYINSQTKIGMLHSKCGHEYEMTPVHFLQGQRCPKCFGTPLKTTEQFKKEVFDLVGNEYTVLGEYINGKTKIGMLHSKCGYKYAVTPFNFITGRRCPKCGGTMKKNTEQFKKEVFDLVGSEYTVLGDYINGKAKIKILHNKCGHEYEVVAQDFISGIRCPKCNQAKGEEKIYKFLVKMGLEKKMQFILKDCKNIRPLPFDFAIFKDDVLKVLIEYDGIHHFQPVNHFGGEKSFKERRRNDKIKNKYCKKNRIPLIRISYTDFENIDSILENKLGYLVN